MPILVTQVLNSMHITVCSGREVTSPPNSLDKCANYFSLTAGDMSSNPRGKDWVFTLNNPVHVGNVPDNPLIPSDDPRMWDGVQYCVFQLESGVSCTPHFQGFVRFCENKRVSSLKKVSSRAHWEPRRGTVEEAVAYCQKEETRLDGPWTIGELTLNGGELKRKRSLEVAEFARKCRCVAEVADKFPDWVLRYPKGVEILCRLRVPPPVVREVEVRLYVGPTGTGKTWTAVHEDPDVYVKDSGKWFGDYSGQKCVVFDDFAGAASHITLTELLRMLDKYRVEVEVKGGFVWLEASLIIVTSNLHPRKWYEWKDRESQYDALMRRFDLVKCFHARDDVVDVVPSEYAD